MEGGGEKCKKGERGMCKSKSVKEMMSSVRSG